MTFREVSATILCIFTLCACGGGGNEESVLITYRPITEIRTGVDDPNDFVELTISSVNQLLIDNNLTATAYSIPSNTNNHTFLMEINGQTINRIFLYATDNWGGGIPPNLSNWRIYSTDIFGTPWELETTTLFFTAYDSINQRIVIQIPQDVSRNYLKLVVDRGATILPAIDITEVQVAQTFPPPPPVGAAYVQN